MIARPITISRRYCWLDVASHDFRTPVASGFRGAYQVTRTWGQSKRRDARTSTSASARTQMSLAVTTVRLELSTLRHAGWNEEREWVWDRERPRHIYLAMWRKSQPNGRHVESSLRASLLSLSRPILPLFFFLFTFGYSIWIYTSRIRSSIERILLRYLSIFFVLNISL